MPNDAIDLSRPDCGQQLRELCVQQVQGSLSPRGRRVLDRTCVKLRRRVALRRAQQVLGARVHRPVGACTHGNVFQAANEAGCQAVVAANAVVLDDPRSILCFGDAIDKQRELASAPNRPASFASLAAIEPSRMIASWRWIYGPDLARRPSPSTALDHVAQLMTNVIRTLMIYRDHGVVHCATNPSNLIWDAEGKTLVLIDPTGVFFPEVAHLWSKGAARDGYQAPELAIGPSAITSKADVFSATQVLWSLATHLDPLPAAHGKKLALALEHSALPKRLKKLIHAGTQLEPSDRPSLERMLSEINEIAAGALTIPPIVKSIAEIGLMVGLAVAKSCK